MTLEETLSIALEAHAGQKDLVGDPAILHLMAVCLAGKTDQQKKVGLLHDIVEDTVMTFDGLLEKGVEKDVVDAVDLLTHRDDDTYEDYIRKIVSSGNETAIQVKLNDLQHNLHRAELALATLDTDTLERKALLDEILAIAAMHDRAERYIQGAITPRP